VDDLVSGSVRKAPSIAKRSDVTGPVDTGVVADIGWPDSTVGAIGAVVQGDVTGTLGEPGRGGVSASTGPAILGQALVSEIPAMVESEMNRDVTYVIPTTPMDREVIHAIPTTELDQDVIRLVEMMMRCQAVRPLIVTMGEERDDLRGCFIVGERFQDRRHTMTSDYAMKIEERRMEQRSLAIRCPLCVFKIDRDELLVYLQGSKTFG